MKMGGGREVAAIGLDASTKRTLQREGGALGSPLHGTGDRSSEGPDMLQVTPWVIGTWNPPPPPPPLGT